MMGWGEASGRSELEIARDDNARLAGIVRDYLAERENPAPDFMYRETLRQRLAAEIGYDYDPRRAHR